MRAIAVAAVLLLVPVAALAGARPLPEPAFVEPFLVDARPLGLWSGTGSSTVAIEGGAMRVALPGHGVLRFERAIDLATGSAALEADLARVQGENSAFLGIVFRGEPDAGAASLVLARGGFCLAWTQPDGAWGSECVAVETPTGAKYALRLSLLEGARVEGSVTGSDGAAVASFPARPARLDPADATAAGYYGFAFGGPLCVFESDEITLLPVA